MTDAEAIEAALSAVDPRARDHVLLTRNGRPFMALPASRAGALHAVNLYQPQRPKAVLAMLGIRALANVKLHRTFFPSFHGIGGKITLDPEFRGCLPGTAGVMLGSPEHRVRRAILSYRTHDGWEVAKVAFGSEGRKVIEGEAAALGRIPPAAPAVPRLLGVHHADDFSMLRMPYVSGKPLSPRDTPAAMSLLQQWVSELPHLAATEFPEWPAIRDTLCSTHPGGSLVGSMESLELRPVIRHGDYARWNLLRQEDGSLMALDWEWGHDHGMPGMDLTHFFLQDHRLVRRLPDDEAIEATLRDLKRPECLSYLRKTGWQGDPVLTIIASLAWKQGAGHQENRDILGTACRMAAAGTHRR